MYIRRGKSNFFVYCKITDFDYIDFDKWYVYIFLLVD